MPRILIALIITIAVEGVAMLALTRKWKWVYYNFLCNFVTNPTLNFSLMLVSYLTGESLKAYTVALVLGETLVFVGEAHLYRALTGETRLKCYMRSIITNALSLIIGLLIF